MPEIDMLDHLIPDGPDAADPEEWFRRYSLSSPGVVTAGSLTEANQIRSEYITACVANGMMRRPFYVWRDDLAQLFMDNGTEAVAEWEHVGGRKHEATIKFARTLNEDPSVPLVLYATEIPFASPGWTLSGNNVVIPATGNWLMSADVHLSGNASTMQRGYFQFSTTNGAIRTRFPATLDNSWAGQTRAYLTAGTQLRIQCYHLGAGSRDWTADVTLDWLGPRWGA